MISIGKPCVVVLLLFSSATIATPASVRDERVNDGSEGPEVTVISASSEADSQMAKSTNGDFRDPEVLVVMAKEWSEDCRSGGEGLQFCSQDRGVSKAQGWQEGGDDPGGRVKPIQINGRMLVTESWQPQQELVQARPLRVKMAEEVREGKEGKEGKEMTGEEYEEGQRGGEDEDEEDKGYETGEIGGGGEEEEVKGYEEGEKGGGGGEEDEEVGQYEERERQGDKEEKDTNNHNSKYDDYNGNYDKVEEAEAKKKGEDMNEEKIAVTNSDLAEDRTNNPQKNDGMDEREDEDDDDDDDEITNEGEQYEERNQKKPEEEAEMTMEEAWKHMKHEADPIEEINSELVEYKLQNIMDYYNPALQKGRNEQEQTSSMSLWQYMVNYVTNGWDNTPPEENVVVDQTKEHNPCKGVPGDYNIWTKTAQPMEVVVVGGGVAGLAALKTLNDLKVKNIVLLEATNRLGGRVKTIRHSSWVVNEGPDAIQEVRLTLYTR
ncbi:S-antigen protein-like isoform X1 [Homarus americanus]|uniref:S-antigen protein-like isoform X1 n=1 Tax=Homarus americanus TaxID=6706 RepID=UPI001C46F80D|nr:S-antigen protein-like isoform X1 [Homarus americanus]